MQTVAQSAAPITVSPLLTPPRCSDCGWPVAAPDPRDKEPLCFRCRVLERDEHHEVLRASRQQPSPPELTHTSLDRIFGDRVGEIPSSEITQAIAATSQAHQVAAGVLELGVIATLCGLLLLAIATHL